MISEEARAQHAAAAGKWPPVHHFDDAAVRVGVPGTPLTDLYYKLIKGSWLLVLSVFGGAYLLANFVFALLYIAGGDCIEGAEPGNFADAFAFSVQTLSTIGYGALSPKTQYGHAVVLLEAMVGVLGVALATGLAFAKFARPRANVRFSDSILIAPYDGRRCLYFRVANLRGNDVVEATVRIVAIKSLVTREGHTLRRLANVAPTRDRSPLFRLSWLVVHVIDEDSPLHGMTLEDFYAERTIIIISLVGLDGTFSQSVNARHVYRPQDVIFDHHFEDIISDLPDGRIEVDFSKLHRVRPLAPEELSSGEGIEIDEQASELIDAETEERCAIQDAEADDSAAE